MFCQTPPFDKKELKDEEFLFAVCDSGWEFLCGQLLPSDVIVMTVEGAKSDRARCCIGLRSQQRLPLLIVLADDRTAIPDYLHPDALVPERATPSELMAVLRNLPRSRQPAPTRSSVTLWWGD